MGEKRQLLEQQGFVLIPKAVTNFYILRYLQWINGLTIEEPFPIHHQYLWDIRMYEPVYQAFSEVLMTKALWANLEPIEPAPVKGRVCLSPSAVISAGKSLGEPCIAQIGDLLIFDASRYDWNADSDWDGNWLSLTLIPAAEHDDSSVRERLHSWNAKTYQTYLTSMGRQLLGLERWSQTPGGNPT